MSTTTATRPSPIEEAFWQFHAQNPHVYDRLVKLARDLRQRGRSHIGIGMLFEVLRWHYAMTTTGDLDGFKLNNNYRALYARLIMHHEPDLAGAFGIRQLRADEPFDQAPAPAPVGHVAPPSVVPPGFDPLALFGPDTA